jgi:hypothetical protein
VAFGGQWFGRGLRERRAIGKGKAIAQLELRRDVLAVVVAGARVDVGLGAFLDTALVAADVGWRGVDFRGGLPAQAATGAARAGDADEAGSATRLLWGGGFGLRLLFNRALLLRVDVAWSPAEAVAPSFYTPFGYPL